MKRHIVPALCVSKSCHTSHALHGNSYYNYGYTVQYHICNFYLVTIVAAKACFNPEFIS